MGIGEILALPSRIYEKTGSLGLTFSALILLAAIGLLIMWSKHRIEAARQWAQDRKEEKIRQEQDRSRLFETLRAEHEQNNTLMRNHLQHMEEFQKAFSDHLLGVNQNSVLMVDLQKQIRDAQVRMATDLAILKDRG